MTEADWTEEQRQNAMTYGVCMGCGAPLELYRSEEQDTDGTMVYTRGICCPNGHR